MNRLPSFQRFLALLPIRWRLALVSFGLLTLLLLALSLLISTTEEQTLLTSQAGVLGNEGHIAQMQVQATKVQLTDAQIRTFPEMSKNMASSFVDSIHAILGQNIGISLLSFDGDMLASGAEKIAGPHNSGLPVVTLARPRIQKWLTARSSYLLANDTLGQRELVILQPIAGLDKSALSTENADTQGNQAGYRKALLQLSVPTTAIDQSIATTRLILTLGLLIALGIAAALTLPLINVALRPLVEMEKTSSRIAAGALSLRLTEPLARDEIGRLARAFNDMVARLEASFARQKRFVADVSHELRTPLTGLGGSLEMLLLRADKGDEATARRLMNGMYIEIERMQRLVVDLLALTRLDEGRFKPQMKAVEVLPLLKEVCARMQDQTHGQELRYYVQPDLAPLRGDRDQLQRVLINIVENALKYTPPGGCVELVASSLRADQVTLEICDTGIGIPPEALAHVFERFYRADASRTRQMLQAGGSGLGLSIAQELVEAHGGTIALNSQAGVGTTVTIQLPAQLRSDAASIKIPEPLP